FDRHTEFIRRSLREAGLLSLPVRRRASNDGYFAGHFDAHAAPFPTACGHHLGGTERADFDVGRKADAKELARFARSLSLLEQLVPVGQLLRLFQRPLIIAAVVSQSSRRVEGKLAG